MIKMQHNENKAKITIATKLDGNKNESNHCDEPILYNWNHYDYRGEANV